MKRWGKYIGLGILVILSLMAGAMIEAYEYTPTTWIEGAVSALLINVPFLLLFYTAGQDKQLKQPTRTFCKVCFWFLAVLLVIGRIVPYIF